MICGFACNKGEVLVVFYLGVVFQFVNFNDGSGLPTFYVDCLSAKYESWCCFGPARIASMRI